MPRISPLFVASVFLFACPQGGSPPAGSAVAEKKVEAPPATPPAPAIEQAPTKARPAPLAKGERRKLEDQADPVKRKAFWAAIQEGRKQTAGKDYARAVASFDAALAELPGHPRALSGRGYARLLAGDLDAAERDLKEALAQPGDPKIESAIAFNLGLVAEKRGDAEAARRHFTEAQTLRPGAAVAAKLADGAGCPAEVDRSEQSHVYANFLEIWRAFAEAGVVDPEAPVNDEALARRLICNSLDFNREDRRAYDACASSKDGPWLVSHEAESWEHHVIQRADGDQWRVTSVGTGGMTRCGQSDRLTMTVGDVIHVRRETGFGTVVEIMDDTSGELVDCADGHDCMTACGEDEVYVYDYLLSPWNPHPVIVHHRAEAQVTVTVQGREAKVSGAGCDRVVPLAAGG